MKKIIDKCRICANEDLKLVFSLTPSPLADSYITEDFLNKKQNIFDLDLYLCENCGLAQLKNIIEPEEIYINYLYKTTTSVGLPEHFTKTSLSVIKKFNLEKNSFIVEIGSNVGSLLQSYKNQGMKILGIDPAKEISKEANKNGIETLNTFFTSAIADFIVNKYGKAKIIHANNVLANIHNLDDVANAISFLLDEDGYFIFETGYILSIIENMLFDTIYHEHISYFGLKPLIWLFDKYNLTLFDAEVIPTKGGSIRCYVTTRKLQQTKRLNNLIENEIKKELYKYSIYKSYQDTIEKTKKNTISFLDKLKNENKKIIGYGASNTTTTLMYHFELYNYIDYIVDDNNIKIGRFCPGNHIPVLSPKKIYEDGIEYIFIFAWRFSDIIIKKHKKFLENGGSFIIPLPQISIITSE